MSTFQNRLVQTCCKMPTENMIIKIQPITFIFPKENSGFLFPRYLAFQNINVSNIPSKPPAKAPVNPNTAIKVEKPPTAMSKGTEKVSNKDQGRDNLLS